MAELGWLRSSTAKVPTNGSLSSSSFNGSNENLFDLLQGRLGSSGAIFGPTPDHAAASYFRPSEQQMNDCSDSASLSKSEDENLQPVEHLVGMQPNFWALAAAAGTTSIPPHLGGLQETHHHGQLYSANSNPAHTVPNSLHPAAAGMDPIDSCHLSSFEFSSLKPHDPSPQLQALRDFMAYGGNNSTAAGTPQHNPAAAGLVGPPMFLHLGDESCSPGSGSLLQLPGMPQMSTFIGENSSPRSKPDMMAYRALCQAELFTTDRSPHRTQFQRENHILAERQRREEMNEKFSALRAMIPKATKKDKASIVGDTIGYVLELEKDLKHLQACKASRKGYFKVLKRKPSLNISASADEECDRSSTGTPELDTAAAADETVRAAASVCPRAEASPHAKPSGAQEMESFEAPIVSSAGDLNAHSNSFQPKAQEDDNPHILSCLEGACKSEVDVQNLGEQAVIKIVCPRSPGLILRILLALDDCKVDVLQSNVTTVAEKSVHFITVQMSSGSSSTTEEMIAVLQKASSSPS